MAKKILVVDDEPDLLKALLFRLGKMGYEVYGASDGQEALNETRRVSPDLIVLDVYLPIITGDEVAKILKADDSLKHIPIVLISASTKLLQEKAIESQVNSFLSKPFPAKDLIAEIARLLQSSE